MVEYRNGGVEQRADTGESTVGGEVEESEEHVG